MKAEFRMTLRVDYIGNFETKAPDAIHDLSTDAEHVDIAVSFLSYRGWVELRPCLTAVGERGGRLRVIARASTDDCRLQIVVTQDHRRNP